MWSPKESGEDGKDLQPRMVNSRLMRRSAPQPRSRKTPRGGSTTAQMILMMSLLGRVSFCVILVLLVALPVGSGVYTAAVDAIWIDLRSGEGHCSGCVLVIGFGVGLVVDRWKLILGSEAEK